RSGGGVTDVESGRRPLFQPHPFGDLLARNREAEAIALQEVDSGSRKKTLLFAVLHSFRDQLEAERAADADNRMHDGRIDRSVAIDDELSIVLNLPEWKPPQVIEAGIAGAEIVEHEGHAGPGETLHRLQHGMLGLEQRAFGNLDLQPLAVELCFRQNP